MRIWFLASEASPFARTGGLGDVVASLPLALAERGHVVTVVLPDYPSTRKVDVARSALGQVMVVTNDEPEVWTIQQARLPGGVHFLFLGQCELFEREGIYGEEGRGDYPDNARRFSSFCRAALLSAEVLGEGVDCYHLHDWPTGVAAAILATELGGRSPWNESASVLTIHNLAFGGPLPARRWRETGLDRKVFRSEVFQDRQISLLRLGLVYADQITAVSRRYAEEIQTPEFGSGRHQLLAKRRQDLTGIVNGIDQAAWDPRTDPALWANYDIASWAHGKGENRRQLRAELELPEAGDIPLIGMIGRVTEQKGFQLLVDLDEALFELDAQYVVLGVGDPYFEARLCEFSALAPERFRFERRFDDALARRIYAASDVLLMPSRFEPCGLTQIYAMRYGAVPVVHAVGGLVDTVVPFCGEASLGRATGFAFDRFESGLLFDTLRVALAAHRQPSTWGALVEAGMKADWSWAKSASEYERVYRRAIEERARRSTLSPRTKPADDQGERAEVGTDEESTS